MNILLIIIYNNKVMQYAAINNLVKLWDKTTDTMLDWVYFMLKFIISYFV